MHAPVLKRALTCQVPLLAPTERRLAGVHAGRKRRVGHSDVLHDDVAGIHAQRVGNLVERQVHRLVARLTGVGRGAGAVGDVVTHLRVDVGAGRLLEALGVGRKHQVAVRLVAVTAASTRLVDVLGLHGKQVTLVIEADTNREVGLRYGGVKRLATGLHVTHGHAAQALGEHGGKLGAALLHKIAVARGHVGSERTELVGIGALTHERGHKRTV